MYESEMVMLHKI